MEYSIEDNVPEGHQERPERTVGRRQLLKVLIAAGGTVTTSAVLSNRWIRPIVEVGVLPAHAQVTYTPTPTPTFRNICYTPTASSTPTPTPTPRCYTPTPTTTTPSPITQESRRSLLERLLAEERFPPDIARELG
jgi:hypothetical protein